MGQPMAEAATDGNARRLLLIDDDVGIRELVCDIAEECGFDATATDEPEQFLSASESLNPSVIVLDLMMPGVDGVELLRALSERSCRSKIMIISGLDSKMLKTAKHLAQAQGLDVLATLQKPLDVNDLEALLANAAGQDVAVTGDELAAAIEKEELIVHYQPKVSLTPSGDMPIYGAEALVRWRDLHRGLILPGAFIPLAEETGLIAPLTDLVVRTAIRDLARWKGKGLGLSIAVNMPPLLLTDLELPDRLVDQLKAADVDPANLVIEITESVAMRDVSTSMDILMRFRLGGIGLSLDDFGTGFSSLVELYRMPFTELKIDQSFVSDIDENEEARIIVRSIGDLARNLGLSVCAEGVETTTALSFLRDLGCERVQGNLISEPLPLEGFEDFVNGWGKRSKEFKLGSCEPAQRR